jgi:hypothetical protein
MAIMDGDFRSRHLRRMKHTPPPNTPPAASAMLHHHDPRVAAMYARLARGKASTAATTRQADRSPIANKQHITAPLVKPRAKQQIRTLDFSHLLPAHAAEDHETDPAAPPAGTRLTQAQIGAAFIIGAGQKSRTPTGTGTPPPPAGSAAGRIIAAGRKRRGEV